MTAERTGPAPRLDPADGGICFIQTWEMPAEAQLDGWLATMHERIHVLTSLPGFRSTPTCSKPSIVPTLAGPLADALSSSGWMWRCRTPRRD
jgi:hypothetical protein